MVPFGTTFVAISFRGFPEFEGLATYPPQALLLDDYITDSLEPMDVLTLFSLIGGTIPYPAVTCCGQGYIGLSR